MNEYQQYMYEHVLTQGEYSDVTIRAFGRSLKLHKVNLGRSSYFKTMLKWADKDSIDIDGSDTTMCSIASGSPDKTNQFHLVRTEDSLITFESFWLLIRRLYGCEDIDQENNISINMFAAGSYFDVPEVCKAATKYMSEHMTMSLATSILDLFQYRDYGSDSDILSQHCKLHLANFGWKAGKESWDLVPAEIAAEIVGDDAFFVPNELERALFLIKLIERKTDSKCKSNELEYLKNALNNNVIYSTIESKALVELSEMRDKEGNTYIKPDSLLFATWIQSVVQLSILSCSTSTLNESNITVPGRSFSKKYYYSKGSHLSWTRFLNESNIPDKKTNLSFTSIPPIRFAMKIPEIKKMNKNSITSSPEINYLGSKWKIFAEIYDTTVHVVLTRNGTPFHTRGFAPNNIYDNIEVSSAIRSSTEGSEKMDTGNVPVPYIDGRSKVACYLNYYVSQNIPNVAINGHGLPVYALSNCDSSSYSHTPRGISFNVNCNTGIYSHAPCGISFNVTLPKYTDNSDFKMIFVLGLV